MFWFFIFMLFVFGFSFIMTRITLGKSFLKSIPFPISYENYRDTSYDREHDPRPSHKCFMIDVKTGKTLDSELAYNQGYLTERQFKLKQLLALSKAKEKLGEDHPSIKALEKYLVK